MRYQTIRGFRDILPQEVVRWQHVEETAKNVLSVFGFREIRLPILEKTQLFARSIGETTDIVEKEMYSFIDKGGESLTLRPEATASVIRAFIEHNLYNQSINAKLFTIGPMFRRERPQKGRYRQFWQINAEIFGFVSAVADAEAILTLNETLKTLKLNAYEIHLNSLGCKDCRKVFKEKLGHYLDKKHTQLCPDCQRRYTLNPMRVFDCKVSSCQMVSETAPLITDYLCLDCKKHFEDLKSYLCLLGIKFILNPRLMRGLDYYTRTAFEVTIPNLGAQKAIAGGGRYDNLVAELGGKATPAVGFAIGIERLLPYVPEETKRERPIFLVFLGEEALKLSLIWAKILREKRIWTEMDYRLGSLKSQLNRANSFKALWTLIIGGDEIKKGKAILRNMDNKEQTNISIHPKEGLSELLKLLGKRG